MLKLAELRERSNYVAFTAKQALEDSLKDDNFSGEDIELVILAYDKKNDWYNYKFSGTQNRRETFWHLTQAKAAILSGRT